MTSFEQAESSKDWVATLPDYSAHLRTASTSLTSRFSIFSLFRTPKPEFHLDSIDALALIPRPTKDQIIAAVSGLNEYIRHIKRTRVGDATIGGDEAAARDVGMAMLGIIGGIGRSSNFEDDGIESVEGREQVQRVMVTTLDGMFALYATIPPTYSTHGAIAREILGAVFEPTVLTPHLPLLLSQPRELVQLLRHSTRTSHLKPASSTPAKITHSPAEEAEAHEAVAIAYMARLDTFIRHVQALQILESYPRVGQDTSHGKAPREKQGAKRKVAETPRQAEKAKADALKASEERVSRIVLETMLVKAEMAASMATARIEDVKRRAGVYDVPPPRSPKVEGGADVRDAGGEDDARSGEDGGAVIKAEHTEVTPKGKNVGKSRKRQRRARTAESDAESYSTPEPVADTPRKIAPASPETRTPTVNRTAAPSQPHEPDVLDEAKAVSSGYKWEAEAEKALIQALELAVAMALSKRMDVLVGKLERRDWLDDGAIPVKLGQPLTPVSLPPAALFDKPGPVPASQASPADPGAPVPANPQAAHDDTDDADSNPDFDSDSADEDEDEDEDDLSHPCPLRTLFRLHDQYQEQRVGIWDRLPLVNASGRRRCSQMEYMRGENGAVGEQWDRLGMGLMKVFDYETLEAYGLEHDKYEEWLDLVKQKGGKSRKRGKRE